MSVDNHGVAAPAAALTLDAHSLRTLRYALGSTIAMTIAMSLNWHLAYLAPVLSLVFLASPAPRPTLKQGIGFIGTVAAACLAGSILGKYLISYPLVYVPLAGLLLFRIFYLKASGRSSMVSVWLLIALLVIPLMEMTSPAIAGMVAMGILASATVTIGVVWLTHGLLPDPLDERAAGAVAAASARMVPPQAERLRTAAISTLVVLPVLILFYSLRMESELLILLFVALLSSMPGFATNFRAGFGLILGNAIGGAAAIVMFELLVMVPQFYFLIAMTFLAGLVFGDKVFSGRPAARLYGMAFSTLLLVIASTTASGTGDAGAKVYTRVGQIIIAVVYVAMASGVAERYVRSRIRREGVAA